MFDPGRAWPLLAGVVALLALAAGACGGDDKSTTTPTPAATGTAAMAELGADDPSDDLPQIGLPAGKIVLGSHQPLSGYGPPPGPEKGLEAYLEYVNAEKGGVCGRQIELYGEDDSYDRVRAVEVTRKLVEEDHVFAMVGARGTGTHSAVWEYLNENGIPDLWVMSGAHKFAADPQAHPWTVPLLPDYTVEGTIQGQYISQNFPGKKVTILYQNDDFGKDTLAGLQNSLDTSKNELVGPQSYEPTAVSVEHEVTYMARTEAEVAVCACIPGYAANAIESADRLGWEPQWIVSYVSSDQLMFSYIAPETMEGTLSLQANKAIDERDDPAIAEHIRIMQEYGDVAPGNFSIAGQIAGELTVEALSRNCDFLSRNSLMDAVESLRDYQSDLSLPGVTWTITPDDHIGIEAMRPLRAKIVNGQGVWEYEGDLISFR